MSDAIVGVLNNDKLRRELANEGIKNISRFSADNIATRWESVLLDMVS